MLKVTLKIMAFINEKLLRNSKEDSIVKASSIQILLATLKYNFKFQMGAELKLEYPNQTLQFPLPNTWTN
jgi:hypothetical protein